MTYADALHLTMRESLNKSNVILLGQNINDHKGMFGTTLGLAEEFGKDVVIDTPICEESVTGLAIGAALNGLYPILIHIRNDFALLSMNQLINLASKYRYMFGGSFKVPMLVRMVVGRSWGQGAQHSQSLQSIFGHFPGFTVIMPSSSSSVLVDYPYLISHCKQPVISLEHRLLYNLEFNLDVDIEPLRARVVREGTDITVVATSLMVLEALRAAEWVQEYVSCEVIDLNCISPIDSKTVLKSLGKTGRLVVVDTGWREYGVCAEICRLVCSGASRLEAQVATLGMAFTPCPTSKVLEDIYYPNTQDIVSAICSVYGISIPLPKAVAATNYYKHFKGPF